VGVPVLWLCGPSGVGKSTVGWAIFDQLSRTGVRSAFLDLDQVGLCYPAPADDPDNHRIKMANLGRVWPTYRSAGVRCLVLSGGVVTAGDAGAYTAAVPDAALTICRLRAGAAELRARFFRRGWRHDLVDGSVAEAEVLDRTGFADLCVDTDGLAVPEVARLVRERAGGWPQR